MIKTITNIFIAVFVVHAVARCQSVDTALQLKKLVTELKDQKNFGFKYVKEAQYPNGDKDRLQGTIVMDTDDKVLLDDGDAVTMLYNGSWIYKADHRKKFISLLNLQKPANKNLRMMAEKQIFANAALDSYLDSFVLKTAAVRKFTIDKSGIEKVSFIFPAGNLIRSLEIHYNTAERILDRYEIVVFQATDQGSKGVKGISTKMVCSNFYRLTDKKAIEQDQFFTYKQGKVELKKYLTYKLTTKI